VSFLGAFLGALFLALVVMELPFSG